MQCQVLNEICFYEAGDATGINLALAATKTASHQAAAAAGGGKASLAGDGSTATAWNSNVGGDTSGAWWACQFAAAKIVRSVVIKPFSNYFSRQYIFETSNDGTLWTPVKTVSTTGGNAATVQTFLNIQ